jgi:hypothetical protein
VVVGETGVSLNLVSSGQLVQMALPLEMWRSSTVLKNVRFKIGNHGHIEGVLKEADRATRLEMDDPDPRFQAMIE